MSFTASAVLGILILMFLLLNVRMLRFVPESRILICAFAALMTGLALELGDDPLAARLPAYRPLQVFVAYIDLAFFCAYCFFVGLWCRRLVQRSRHASR